MPAAFVLINSESKAEQDLVNEIKGIDNVVEASFVYGLYDVVAMVEADTLEKVKDTVTSKIRHLEKIRSVLTMMVVD